MIKISVVVPVYNSELYLKKCIKSIMEQTFKEEYEVILVNDGSIDHSENIIDRLIDTYGKDKIIKINQENSGQGKARNEGVKKARGEYVLFVDCDDHIKNTMLEDLYNEAQKENADIVVCDYTEEINGGEVYKKSLYNNEEDIKKNYIISVAGPCSKLIKTSLIKENELYFPENIIYEDLAIVPTWAIFSENVAYKRQSYYYYYIRNNSTMRQMKYSKKLQSIFIAMEHLENTFKNKNCYEKYHDEIEYLFIEHLLYAGTGRLLQFEEAKDDIKKIHDIMEEKFPDWKKNKYYLQRSKSYKIKCNIFFKNNKLLISLYKKLRKIK